MSTVYLPESHRPRNPRTQGVIVYMGPKYENFYLKPIILCVKQNAELIFVFWKFRFQVCFINRFEENEFNSTVLWLRVTLLSISRPPFIFFCFQVMSRET